MHRGALDEDPTVKLFAPSTDLVATTVDLINVLKHLSILVVDKLQIWDTRTRDENHAGVPPCKCSFRRHAQDIHVEQAEEEIERAVPCSEVIDNGSMLSFVTIEPFETIGR